MYDELTEVDVKKMREELEYRELTLRPKLIEDVKVARAFGDLSENFEYKAAKREKKMCIRDRLCACRSGSQHIPEVS